MGQHHSNPTAKLAKEGKLPPKPTYLSKREQELRLRAAVSMELAKRTHLPLSLFMPYI